MKIVFLDMDGVLVHHRCKHRMSESFITDGDLSCVERLKRILRETGAKIVLHSTWAYVDSRDYLLDWFQQYGIYEKDFAPDWICTSTDKSKRDKPEAIDTWLKNHRDIDKYIILEDEQLYGLTDPRRGKVILIVSGWIRGGIQDVHADAAIKCLTYRP
jgi:hypothetical protein